MTTYDESTAWKIITFQRAVSLYGGALIVYIDITRERFCISNGFVQDLEYGEV